MAADSCPCVSNAQVGEVHGGPNFFARTHPSTGTEVLLARREVCVDTLTSEERIRGVPDVLHPAAHLFRGLFEADAQQPSPGVYGGGGSPLP